MSELATRGAYSVFIASYVVFTLGKFPGMAIDRPGAAIIGAKYSSLHPWRVPVGRILSCAPLKLFHAFCGQTISHSFPNYFQLR
jgi:hypothetical protein